MRRKKTSQVDVQLELLARGSEAYCEYGQRVVRRTLSESTSRNDFYGFAYHDAATKAYSETCQDTAPILDALLALCSSPFVTRSFLICIYSTLLAYAHVKKGNPDSDGELLNLFISLEDQSIWLQRKSKTNLLLEMNNTRTDVQQVFKDLAYLQEGIKHAAEKVTTICNQLALDAAESDEASKEIAPIFGEEATRLKALLQALEDYEDDLDNHLDHLSLPTIDQSPSDGKLNPAAMFRREANHIQELLDLLESSSRHDPVTSIFGMIGGFMVDGAGRRKTIDVPYGIFGE